MCIKDGNWVILHYFVICEQGREGSLDTQPKMAASAKMQNFKLDKICRACLQVKKDMRPLFEQLTATMLMGISKVQVRDPRWRIDLSHFWNILLSLLHSCVTYNVRWQPTLSSHLCLEVIEFQDSFVRNSRNSMRNVSLSQSVLRNGDTTGWDERKYFKWLTEIDMEINVYFIQAALLVYLTLSFIA